MTRTRLTNRFLEAKKHVYEGDEHRADDGGEHPSADPTRSLKTMIEWICPDYSSVKISKAFVLSVSVKVERF